MISQLFVRLNVLVLAKRINLIENHYTYIDNRYLNMNKALLLLMLVLVVTLSKPMVANKVIIALNCGTKDQ